MEYHPEKKMMGNCIIAPSAWCKVFIFFFFSDDRSITKQNKLIHSLSFNYSETSENRSFLIIGQFFKSLPNIFLERKSHKTGHPSKPAIFIGSSSGQLREVLLYIETQILCNIPLYVSWFVSALYSMALHYYVTFKHLCHR
jgi:hypothetical protein